MRQRNVMTSIHLAAQKAFDRQERFEQCGLALIQENGETLGVFGDFSRTLKVEGPSLSALIGGLWSSAEGIQELSDHSILSFEDGAEGFALAQVQTPLFNVYLLRPFGDNCIYGKVKYELRLFIEDFKFELSRLSESSDGSKKEESPLFPNIQDDEISALFSFN